MKQKRSRWYPEKMHPVLQLTAMTIGAAVTVFASWIAYVMLWAVFS